MYGVFFYHTLSIELQGGSWKSPWHRYTYCRVGGTAYAVGEPMPSSDVCKTGW